MPDGTIADSFEGRAILEAQRAAFLAAEAPDLAARRDKLDRLGTAIRTRRHRLEAALAEDFGQRAAEESALVDLGPTVRAIGHMKANLRRWMAPERRRVGLLLQPGRAQVRYQPLGIVGIMSAWNYPVSLALTPLATALAAGNRAMLKPSELAPATAEALAEMLANLFPPDEVAVVRGGPEVAAAFAALPFDHLFFTGSTAVGREVMRAAAETLTPVTLELGGKSPVILTPDADLARVGADLAFGKATNAGQTCIAPDYLLAHPDQVEPVAEAFAATLRRSYPRGLADPGLTSIVSDRHLARLTALLEDALKKGAEIRAPLAGDTAPAHPRVLGPALVLGATPDMAILQEEIFGPLLPVVTCENPEAAIAFVNARPRPLALYVYGQDRGPIETILARTTSGNVTVNGVMLHYAVDSLPFGGIGPSGIGAYHGIEGFRRLSHAKGIFEPGRHHGVNLIRPPYSRIARFAAKLMLR